MLKMKKEEVPWEEGTEKMKQIKVDTKEDFYFDIEGQIILVTLQLWIINIFYLNVYH